MNNATLDVLATVIAAQLRCQNEALCLQLVRLLGVGEPVSPAYLAATLNMAEDMVEGYLRHMSDAEFDESGNIVGWGMSLRPTSHQFAVKGHSLFTWCALDTLMYSALLGVSAQVVSQCAVTELEVQFTVTGNGVIGLAPSQAVISVVIPSGQGRNCNRSNFCNQGFFFCSPEAATHWQQTHPEAFILTVEEGYKLGRLVAGYRLAAATEHTTAA
jgi:alkylmercury lyase